MAKIYVTKFETPEDMIAWLSENDYNRNRRWQLNSIFVQAWKDPEEGKAWEEKVENANVAEFRILDDNKPERVKKYEYYLYEAGSGSLWRSSTKILLSEELGRTIHGIWTTKKSKYGNLSQRVGMLSVPGMLKRLEKAGYNFGGQNIAKKLDQVKEDAKNAKIAKQRQMVIDRAQELGEMLNQIIEANPEIEWTIQNNGLVIGYDPGIS